MLFLGLHAKVKLYIKGETQGTLSDIEEQKRRFKASLAALEAQKRKEKLVFARAITSLKRCQEAEKSASKTDYNKIIGRLQEQIEMLVGIKDDYDGRVNELKQLGCGLESNQDANADKDQRIGEMEDQIDALKQEVQVLKENHTWLKKDNNFKTEQLNTFLKDCGAKNEQLYALRKQLIEQEGTLKTKSDEIAALTTQLA